MLKKPNSLDRWIARHKKQAEKELLRELARLCNRFGAHAVKAAAAKIKLARGRPQNTSRTLQEMCVYQAVRKKMEETKSVRPTAPQACRALCLGEGFKLEEHAKALGFEGLTIEPNSIFARPITETEKLRKIYERTKHDWFVITAAGRELLRLAHD
jgi:hypothetical protein